MDNPEYTAARINEALADFGSQLEVYWDGDIENATFDVLFHGDDTSLSVEDTGHKLIVHERIGNCDYTVEEVLHYIEVARALIRASNFAFIREAA